MIGREKGKTMHALTVYATQDGQHHATPNDAKRHAAAIYGNALSHMAARLLQITKATPMHEFIDTNLSEFAQLALLKADMYETDESNDSE
jgi:hypothetical protein